MSGASKKLMGTTAAAAGGDLLAIEDVFSTYLYTGTPSPSTQTITNGIDLAGEGGLVWIKRRDTAVSHLLHDSERAATTRYLRTDVTNAEANDNGSVTSFNSDGFTVGDWIENTENATYASWTFRKAPRFFDVVTYTGDGDFSRHIQHNLGVVPGAVFIKRTDVSANWIAVNRFSSGNYGVFYLNETNAQLSSSLAGPPTSTAYVSDTTFGPQWYTVGGATDAETNASGGTYVAYLFAHDPLGPSGDGSDGLIACGSYTGTGAVGNAVDLGFEPQFLLIKRTDSVGSWHIFDTMRGITDSGNATLYPNLSNAEVNAVPIQVNSNGFTIQTTGAAINGNTGNYIYIAIRRGPMRQPTSGTEVYQAAYKRTALPAFLSGFPVDMAIQSDVSGGDHNVSDRLRGSTSLKTNDTSAESSQTYQKFDYMDGYYSWTVSYTNYFAHMFRRAPGFFDVVAYTGDGVSSRTVSHNLGVAPEMMIVKQRNAVRDWVVQTAANNFASAGYLQTNGSFGFSPSLYSPTSTTFTASGDTRDNASGGTYVAYLFATLPGVSKVGSYTGNGSSQTIDCGFTSGARFVLIKRTDSTGDWYVWDTARGIVAANDPHLSLNSTAAEVTTDDSIDPDSSGFIVNQVAATNINVNAASYIFLAIA